MGIRHVGAKVARTLATKFTNLANLLNAQPEELAEIRDIGNKIAESVVTWFSVPANRDLLERLAVSGRLKNDFYRSCQSKRIILSLVKL